MLFKNVFPCIVIGVLLLSGCDSSKDNTTSNSNSVPQAPKQQNSDQKYSLFVKAFNLSNGNFPLFDSFNKFMANDFEKKDLYNIDYLNNQYIIDDSLKKLKEAIAIKDSSPELTELTEVAQKYIVALEAFKPIDNTMKQYVETKAYLNDSVADRKAKANPYIAGYKEVLQANHDFYNAINKVDFEKSKVAYESAPDKSIEKAITGLVWHGKQSNIAFEKIISLPKVDQNDYTELTSIITNLEGDIATLNAIPHTGCESIPSAANHYIGNLRSFMKNASDNPNKAPAESGWVNAVGDGYNAMIDFINNQQCQAK
ncbi:DUF3829 domain-containing protein [Desulfovibrio litoralis]|uniref:T-box domain-containing protein n=1 Tax=Desulfovibrio litoralis DSM 11393 TaxID=1121455 RepID=A0A1M7RZB4_9BACT|nr:DUF3829 domain-containing protein [Desulfovibrio litoralis]SHN51518.1 Protein of unknown function [Desulfovibrio litoralis DSM 11393]